MANLSTFSTIHESVIKYKSDYATENLSAAFAWLALETILHLNEDEIEDAITDGPMDGGIDAIHIDGREVHVFNFKYAEKFEASMRAFPDTEVDKLLTTMARIYGKSLSKTDVNEILWDKVRTIWELFEAGSLNFNYYLCSNREKPVEHTRRKLENELSKYVHVKCHYYDQEDIVSKILEKRFRRVDGSLTFIDKQYFERGDGPLKGIVATIAASDLINLVKDPDRPEAMIEDVFNENVRVFLKLSNRINRNIFETALSDDNFEFWYLNNGVTIVCDECVYTPNSRSPRARLSNLQIVNGGQTTHALFQAYMKDANKLDAVLLLVRICETKKDYHIGEKIRETTNSQTPVSTRDLHANDRIQRKLEEQFLDLGFYYERKANQHQDQPKARRLNNELLGQIYLAYYLDMPSEAKNSKVLVFGGKYDDIFDEDVVTTERMLAAYQIYRPLEGMKKEIQSKKRRGEAIVEREAFLSRATFHLLNAVKIVSQKEALDLRSENSLTRAIEKAVVYVGEVVALEATRRGELYTHDKFFKEIATNKTISEYVLGKYASDGSTKPCEAP
ncbi:MAG: AIPR family protein [Chloroflexi bacterium]|nr:AIPR family protein [Chloroflexota bacterium]